MALTRVLTDLQQNYTLPAICDDISNQFNGSVGVFPLSINGATINTVTDSRQVQVAINGQILRPYVTERAYPWIMEYSINGEYRITTDGNIIIYNPPDAVDRASVVLVTYGTYTQAKTLSYSVNPIVFGD